MLLSSCVFHFFFSKGESSKLWFFVYRAAILFIFILLFFNKMVLIDEIMFLFYFLNFVTFSFIYFYNHFSLKVSKEILPLFLLLEISIYLCIWTTNLLLFYIAFEITLFFFFYLISILGSRSRKIHATYLLILYTVFGSIFLLSAMVLFWFIYGTLEISNLSLLEREPFLERVIALLLFIGFAVKVPLFPLHLWLLEAHVEAHTTTSVLLAAMILKLGGIGMLKFMVPFLSWENQMWFLSWIVGFLVFGLIFCSISLVYQLDLKRFVALSSIIHMNFSMISLFSLTEEGISGFILSMFAHGLTAAGLFFSIGILYERFGSRNLLSFGSLVILLPRFTFCFFIFLLCNASFPGTLNFLGEIVSFFGIQEKSFSLSLFLLIILSNTILMSFWVGVKLSFGNRLTVSKFSDIHFAERVILYSLVFLNLLFGLFLSERLTSLISYEILFF